MDKIEREIQAQQLNTIIAQLDFITSMMMDRLSTTKKEEELKSHLQETGSALSNLVNEMYRGEDVQ